MSAIQRLGLSPAPQAPAECSATQSQTMEAFGFKWKQTSAYESEAVQEDSRRWLFERYCGGDPALLDSWLEGGRKVILDAGCGSGYSAAIFFGERLKGHDYLGVDISDAVEVGRRRFADRGLPGEFLRMPLGGLTLPEGAKVDMIFSEGVLHHTDSTRDSIAHLSGLLREGGRFLFYVYAKKAVIREFTDDHVRQYLQPMNEEEALAALMPLSRLGKALGDLGATIDIPEDIGCLGIKKGTYDLQRFFFYNICKAFYQPSYTLEEMNLINYDWFRPLNCHRHTPEEIRGYCEEAGLEIERMDVQSSGITVVAVRK